MKRVIAVGWEYEVPLDEIQSARDTMRTELESHFFSTLESLTDLDIARYLVRTAHPTTRYLRADVRGLGFQIRTV